MVTRRCRAPRSRPPVFGTTFADSAGPRVQLGAARAISVVAPVVIANVAASK